MQEEFVRRRNRQVKTHAAIGDLNFKTALKPSSSAAHNLAGPLLLLKHNLFWVSFREGFQGHYSEVLLLGLQFREGLSRDFDHRVSALGLTPSQHPV